MSADPAKQPTSKKVSANDLERELSELRSRGITNITITDDPTAPGNKIMSYNEQ